MKKENDWIHTGETENGMKIWVKQEVLENIKYLKYQYRKDDGTIIYSADIPFTQVRLLNGLIDTLERENGI